MKALCLWCRGPVNKNGRERIGLVYVTETSEGEGRQEWGLCGKPKRCAEQYNG